MSSFNFKFAAVATLTYTLLASAAVPHKRSTEWLQQNGPAAKALNDQYASLTPNSTCNDSGALACIDGEFATCYEGKYLMWPCASGWECAAIPNEWSSGTTTTCDSTGDISWRFAQAGISETKRSLPSAKRSTEWLQQNGPAAQALNDQYASLTTSSSCSGGVACIGGQYATCNDGRWFTWPCPNDWTCAAIPNEWSEGTTTTCDSTGDISWRFAQAGISES